MRLHFLFRSKRQKPRRAVRTEAYELIRRGWREGYWVQGPPRESAPTPLELLAAEKFAEQVLHLSDRESAVRLFLEMIGHVTCAIGLLTVVEITGIDRFFGAAADLN